jgi:hypothetical protein
LYFKELVFGMISAMVGNPHLAAILGALAAISAAFTSLFADEAAAEGRETIFRHRQKSASCRILKSNFA